MKRSRRIIGVVPTILIVVALALGTVWAADGNLPAGTSISVEIASPEDGTFVASPPGDITLEGTAAIGAGEPQTTTLIVFVLDVSYSTMGDSGTTGVCDDGNTDGVEDTILDCEITAAKALNDQAALLGTVGEVGVAVYGMGGDWADMSPKAGEQPTTPPGLDWNGAAITDTHEVLGSAFSEPTSDGGVTQFTLRNVGSDGTNFAAGLEATAQIVLSSTMTSKIIVFMSDGLANRGAHVDTVGGLEDVIIRAFAIGAGSDCATGTGGAFGSLNDVADRGKDGSVCDEVEDVADLPDIVPGLIESELSSVKLSINGGAEIGLSTDPSLPQTGPASVTFSHPLPGLEPSMYEFCVTATGSDAGGEGDITDCIDATVADIMLEPATATNELGDPKADQRHTVTATVAAGADGGVEGVQVQFEIISGPNAMGPETAMTDANGQAMFTYEAKQGLEGLGTDEIQACFTDDLGIVACDMAEKIWQDTTAPEVACVETTNPSGKNTPKSKNPDGFYELTAEDWVDDEPDVFLLDTGSGMVFPPAEAFVNGTKIKYTEAPGTSPRMKKMGSEKGQGNAIDWHILGNGDACVFATDASGNQSECVLCLVPPPPK